MSVAASACIGLSSQVYAKYTQPSNFNSLKRVSINKGNSQNAVRNAIKNNRNGVVITLKKGTHNWSNTSVELKKNVHIRFESGVIINRGKFEMVGGNNSIVGPVKMNAPTPSNRNNPIGTRYVAASTKSGANVDNFLIEKLTINNKWTWGQTIGINHPAKNGTIKDIKSTNNPPGYGLVQIQGGQNLDFKHLDSTGGFSLRLEQTSKSGTKHRGKISLTAKNVICRKGRSAVYILPAIRNGAATITQVRAYGCAWAIEGGSKNNGRFSRVTVKDILAKYGTKMQTKRSGYGIPFTKDFVPDSLQSRVKTMPDSQGGEGRFLTGPSLGCIFNNPSWVTYNSYRRKDFPSVYNRDPLIITSGNIDRVVASR